MESKKKEKVLKKRLTKKQKYFIEIIKNTMGNVSLACTKLGISRRTYYNWFNLNDTFAELVDDIREKNIDFAESQLLSNIREGKETSLIFYLKTIGKDRGYVERHEQVVEMNPFLELMKKASKVGDDK